MPNREGQTMGLTSANQLRSMRYTGQAWEVDPSFEQSNTQTIEDTLSLIDQILLSQRNNSQGYFTIYIAPRYSTNRSDILHDVEKTHMERHYSDIIYAMTPQDYDTVIDEGWTLQLRNIITRELLDAGYDVEIHSIANWGRTAENLRYYTDGKSYEFTVSWQ